MRDRLANSIELLDAPVHDHAELEQSLGHVAEVNYWLGGYRAVLRALGPLVQRGVATSILDIGTGSADIPLVIDRWAQRCSLDVTIHATDVHPQMSAIAAQRVATTNRIVIETADALALPFRDRAFDVVLLSLTLHHFERDAQLRALREAARVARRAIIVNELERNWPNLLGARFLALTRWRSNRLTRHDGPLSVLRAFRPLELTTLASAAGLPVASLQRGFFYRLTMVIDVQATIELEQPSAPLQLAGT